MICNECFNYDILSKIVLLAKIQCRMGRWGGYIRILWGWISSIFFDLIILIPVLLVNALTPVMKAIQYTFQVYRCFIGLAMTCNEYFSYDNIVKNYLSWQRCNLECVGWGYIRILWGQILSIFLVSYYSDSKLLVMLWIWYETVHLSSEYMLCWIVYT